ncbi:AidA/PixA family protein [Burkholderia ubonensis]|uniref:AidA/PixA family protein n=1 Tax=Burkholderia ubonensis TaxID=101571 RepID=UPI0009B4B11B|nr:AidA/PixA family protein [Burkholderia ubonensis]
MGHREILAGAPATIEIIALFDIELILHDHPIKDNTSPQTATWIQHGPESVKYAYLVAPEEYVDPKTNATPDLTIYGLTGDTVRWRGLSFSGNINHAGALVSIKPNGASTVLRFLPPPHDVLGTYLGYDIDKSEPYDIRNFLDNRIDSSVVRSNGTDNYIVVFALMETDRKTGKLGKLGFYQWDPQVTCLA